MTPEERRRLDRYLDRLERVLTKDPETYRRERKEGLLDSLLISKR